MLSNINSFNGNYNINSTVSSEVDDIIEAHKSSKVKPAEIDSNVNENLYLSGRAKKINALSTEFFDKGAMNFNDVNALKERVYQLGLISKQEYARLTDSDVVDKSVSLNEKMSSQTLANFSGDFVERLNKGDASENENDIDSDVDNEKESESLLVLKEALLTAKNILLDVNSAKNDSDFKESLSSALSALRETINADTFKIIPLDDKIGISKVYQALEIVDKISQNRLSNAKVNRYIEISLD